MTNDNDDNDNDNDKEENTNNDANNKDNDDDDDSSSLQLLQEIRRSAGSSSVDRLKQSIERSGWNKDTLSVIGSNDDNDNDDNDGNGENGGKRNHRRGRGGGKTPLIMAAWKGSIDCVRYLIEDVGCNINVYSKSLYSYGKTPLFFALTQSRQDVVEYLLGMDNTGSDIDDDNDDNEDEKNRNAHERRRMLPKVTIVNNKGQSPLSLASSHNMSQRVLDRIRFLERRQEQEWKNIRMSMNDKNKKQQDQEQKGEKSNTNGDDHDDHRYDGFIDTTNGWWNFRRTHSDGLQYGDLDPRYYLSSSHHHGYPNVVITEYAVNPTTKQTRKNGFAKRNPMVAAATATTTVRSRKKEEQQRRRLQKQEKEQQSRQQYETEWEQLWNDFNNLWSKMESNDNTSTTPTTTTSKMTITARSSKRMIRIIHVGFQLRRPWIDEVVTRLLRWSKFINNNDEEDQVQSSSDDDDNDNNNKDHCMKILNATIEQLTTAAAPTTDDNTDRDENDNDDGPKISNDSTPSEDIPKTLATIEKIRTRIQLFDSNIHPPNTKSIASTTPESLQNEFDNQQEITKKTPKKKKKKRRFPVQSKHIKSTTLDPQTWAEANENVELLSMSLLESMDDTPLTDGNVAKNSNSTNKCLTLPSIPILVDTIDELQKLQIEIEMNATISVSTFHRRFLVAIDTEWYDRPDDDGNDNTDNNAKYDNENDNHHESDNTFNGLSTIQIAFCNPTNDNIHEDDVNEEKAKTTIIHTYVVDLIVGNNDHSYKICAQQLVAFLMNSPDVLVLGFAIHHDLVLMHDFAAACVDWTESTYDQQHPSSSSSSSQSSLSTNNVLDLQRWFASCFVVPGHSTTGISRNLTPGLKTCASYVSSVPLSKKEQCSQWHKRPLTQSQIQYAGLDAAILLVLLAEGHRRI